MSDGWYGLDADSAKIQLMNHDILHIYDVLMSIRDDIKGQMGKTNLESEKIAHSLRVPVHYDLRAIQVQSTSSYSFL